MITGATVFQAMVFGGTGAFNLIQCTNRTIDPGNKTMVNRGGGDPVASWISMLEADPIISSETTEIARFGTNVNYLAGKAVDSAGSGITSLDVYYSHLENFAARKSGSNHSKIGSITKALVCPKQISVRQGGEATASFDIVCCSSNGTAAPWTYAGSQSLSVTPDVTEKFTMGPIKENTTQLDGTLGWTFDFGCELKVLKDGGSIYPTWASIITNTPTFKIPTNDTTYLSSVGSVGRITSSTLDFYLTKLTNRMTGGVARVANATAEHVKFRIPSGQALITCGPATGSNNQVAELELTVQPVTSSGTFLTISYASAIT